MLGTLRHLKGKKTPTIPFSQWNTAIDDLKQSVVHTTNGKVNSAGHRHPTEQIARPMPSASFWSGIMSAEPELAFR